MGPHASQLPAPAVGWSPQGTGPSPTWPMEAQAGHQGAPWVRDATPATKTPDSWRRVQAATEIVDRAPALAAVGSDLMDQAKARVRLAGPAAGRSTVTGPPPPRPAETSGMGVFRTADAAAPGSVAPHPNLVRIIALLTATGAVMLLGAVVAILVVRKSHIRAATSTMQSGVAAPPPITTTARTLSPRRSRRLCSLAVRSSDGGRSSGGTDPRHREGRAGAGSPTARRPTDAARAAATTADRTTTTSSPDKGSRVSNGAGNLGRGAGSEDGRPSRHVLTGWDSTQIAHYETKGEQSGQARRNGTNYQPASLPPLPGVPCQLAGRLRLDRRANP